MGIMATSKSEKGVMLDVLITPLRGLILPIYDAWRRKPTKTIEQEVPAWAVSDMRNTPIPYTVEHQYDFGYGGVYGPPDMPVKAGVVNQPRTVRVQYVHNGVNYRHGEDTEYVEDMGFSTGPTDNIELFVYSPFALKTDLPCSTVMNKY